MKNKLLFLMPLLAVLSVGLYGCGNDLEKQGYTYDEPNGWYVKEGEEENDKLLDGTFVNLTKSQSNLSKQYVITSTVNRVVFIGNSSVNYTNFNIIVEGRQSDVYIELQNFKFEAPEGADGINADDVFPSYNVFIMSSGTSAVKGGKGESGTAGTSYKYNGSSGAPKNGGKGLDGGTGCSAISGNTVYLTAKSSSILTLIGGDGGNGGIGGDGEGSKGGGLGTVGKGAGNGGNGGTGGQGGSAVNISSELKIENNGKISLLGGTGGNGGTGGRGGNGGNPSFASPDDGGDGGNGGTGGTGGFGINLQENASLKVSNQTVSVEGGNGGNGGSGNNGGDGHKWAMDYVSKGANAGDAGNGGNGGNGGLSTNFADKSLFNHKNGQGGDGGFAGNPGSAPKGDGNQGIDGKSGDTPV